MACAELFSVLMFGNDQPLAAVELSFSVIKLVILIGWLYLCLFCIQKIQLNPTLSDPAKIISNLAGFFFGPFIVTYFFIKATNEKSREDGVGFMDSLRDHFNSFGDRIRNIGADSVGDINIYDSSGRSIGELYGHGSRNRSQDRHTLDLTQQIILDAIEQGASDILIDPKDNAVHVIRYRVDGVLREIEQVDSVTCQAIIK